MSDRIPCEVPFCRRTAPRAKYPEEGVRIICGKCWRLGDARFRRVYSSASRQLKKFGPDEWLAWIRHRSWERVLRQAIERRGGIGSL